MRYFMVTFRSIPTTNSKRYLNTKVFSADTIKDAITSAERYSHYGDIINVKIAPAKIVNLKILGILNIDWNSIPTMTEKKIYRL